MKYSDDMPGVSIKHTRSPHQSDAVRETLDELRYFDDHVSRVLRDRQPWAIGATTHRSYPITEFETDDYWICLEGKIYDTYIDGTLSNTLESIASTLFSKDDTERRRTLRKWLRETDGEFVLYVVEKSTDRLAILNDLFGRLPLYYTDSSTSPVFTREIGFFFEFPFENLAFDQHAISQYLLFGYMLGKRTLWENIRKLPPATRVIIRPDGNYTFESITEFDFDEKRHSDRSIEENARNLADLFVEACEARSEVNHTNVLSLSGGHDSRSVAAAFHAADLPCSAATFMKETQDTSADATIAREISRELDFDWQLFSMDAVNTSHADTLLTLKRGLNHLGLSSLLDFFEQLRATYGSDITYFTGDGGDKTLPDLSPDKPVSTHDELVSYTIDRNSVFSLRDVAALTGLDRAAIVDEVSESLAAYPESIPSNKYVHFLTHERGFSWLFEGEDRNRYYFWSTSPFYSSKFFDYAMNIPNEQKSHNRLYREFLQQLWPRATEFDDANFGTPMTSPRYKILQYGLSLLGRYPSLEDVARIIYRGEINSRYHPNIARLLDEYMDRSESLDEYLNTDEIAELIEDPTSCGHHQIFNVLTISAALTITDRGTAFTENEVGLEIVND